MPKSLSYQRLGGRHRGAGANFPSGVRRKWRGVFFWLHLSMFLGVGEVRYLEEFAPSSRDSQAFANSQSRITVR